MPSIKKQLVATSDDALSAENLAFIEEVSVINLYAVTQTAGDQIGLNYGQRILLPSSTNPNLVTDADTGPKPQDDHLLVDEVVLPGQRLVMPVNTLTAQTAFLLTIQPLQ
jgi:hypothetical protein